MISGEVIQAADKWLATVVCGLFPGILILDCIFGLGIFGKAPDSIYSFLLYIVYCAAISFLYVYLSQAQMERYLDAKMLRTMGDDKVGVVTIPLVIAMSAVTVGSHVLIGEVAKVNPWSTWGSHGRVINAALSIFATYLATPFLGRRYFKWYRSTFKLSDRSSTIAPEEWKPI